MLSNSKRRLTGDVTAFLLSRKLGKILSLPGSSVVSNVSRRDPGPGTRDRGPRAGQRPETSSVISTYV